MLRQSREKDLFDPSDAQTVCFRLYLPAMPAAMFLLAFIDTAGTSTVGRIAGAWKARAEEDTTDNMLSC